MSKALTCAAALLMAFLLLAQCGRRHAAPAAAVAYSGPSGPPYAMSFDTAMSDASILQESGTSRSGVQLVGRFVVDGPQQIRFGWPNSAIGGRFVGTSLSVEMEDYQPMVLKGQPANNIFNVTIDDQPATSLVMQPGVSLYFLAQGLRPGPHTVWLSKRTEGWVGSTYFMRFVPGPGGAMLKPPPLRPRRIEFIGASNETGYGDMAAVTAQSMCRYSPATQNADIAYPRLVADAFNADLVNIAYAGKGVLQNDDPVHDPSDTMPVLYDRSDPLDADAASRWEFAGPTPQAVVVNLGGNDFASEIPPQRDFVHAYVGFLKQVRHRYPRAQIFCVMGPTVGDPVRGELRSYIQAVVRARHDDGDNATQYFEFAQYRGESLGCDYHPDAALQRSMANALRSVLADKLHW